MVVNRYTICCKTCEEQHTLRITLGADRYQEHTFACVNCGEDIKVGLDIDFDNRIEFENFPIPGVTFPNSSLSVLSNCELCEGEGTILNLDPHFLIPEQLLHDDKVIPWLLQIPFEEIEKINIIAQPRKSQESYPKLIDIFSLVEGIRNLRESIEFLIKAWSLHNRGKYDLSSEYLGKLASKLFDKAYSLYDSIFIFNFLFIGHKREDVKIIISELKEAKKKNPLEYSRFREYYIQQADECLDRHLEILKYYLKNYDDLNQVYLYAKTKKDIPDGMTISSKRFREVKMFYGDIYEYVTVHLFIPACINNILNGRSFDTFEQMDLKKYLTINKANRANPFKDSKSFAPIISCLDSTLRNASHHGSMKLAGNSNLIKYRSGGTGSCQTISYANYLYKCNEIMFSACILLMMELSIIENKI
jgi:hypothetical protein